MHEAIPTVHPQRRDRAVAAAVGGYCGAVGAELSDGLPLHMAPTQRRGAMCRRQRTNGGSSGATDGRAWAGCFHH
jgi:hypothetical protein